MKRIGVVIPFYGGVDYLPQLLSSIYAVQMNADICIYIVDNSKQGEQLDDSFTYEKTYVIKAAPGLGYGKACNIGFVKCKEDGCDVLVIVNQDGYFAKGSFELLVSKLIANDSYSVAVPLLTCYESDEIEPFFTHVYLTPMPELISDLFRGTIKPYYRIEQLCGASFALKLKDYQGFEYLFDELYHMYFEDADLYERLNRLQKRVMFVPSAVFHHQHSNTNEAVQTVYTLAVKRASHHIFYLKNRNASSFHTVLSWCVLEFRTLMERLLKLELKFLLIELISVFQVIKKFIIIMKKRRT